MNTTQRAQQVFDATGRPSAAERRHPQTGGGGGESKSNHEDDDESVDASETMDDAGYLANFNRMSFEPESCVGELVGNSHDAKAKFIKFEIFLFAPDRSKLYF